MQSLRLCESVLDHCTKLLHERQARNVRDIPNKEVERHVAGSLNDLFATAAEETFVDNFQMATDSATSQKKSTINRLF